MIVYIYSKGNASLAHTVNVDLPGFSVEQIEDEAWREAQSDTKSLIGAKDDYVFKIVQSPL